MQLRNFYGRTLAGALARVKRELGPDALILETRSVPTDSPVLRVHPGARYEIVAVRENGQAIETPGVKTPAPVQAPVAAGVAPVRPAAVRPAAPAPSALLKELGAVRSQLHQLLQPVQPPVDPAADPRVDIADYNELICLGVDHQVLAPHFRAWLAWKTASPAVRRYLARSQGGAAVRMQGESLHEWLWLAWVEKLGLGATDGLGMGAAANGQPQIISMVGPTGSGKSTSLAKMSSIFRRDHRRNAVILTLDTQRIGATEQWRRWGKLMGVDVHEIVTQEDLTLSMEKWAGYGWIGIDTPGSMAPESQPARLYGSILAQCLQMETVLALPVTQDETVSRRQMQQARALGSGQVLFTKLDETPKRGGLVNLTMDGQWKINSLSAGTRVPEDWEPATDRNLWTRVFACHGQAA